MSADDELAQWAALFMQSYAGSEVAPIVAPNVAPIVAEDANPINDNGLTQSAIDLLRSVDAGGVPAFVTANLLQIAADNGVEVTSQQTPNEIVELIRAKLGR